MNTYVCWRSTELPNPTVPWIFLIMNHEQMSSQTALSNRLHTRAKMQTNIIFVCTSNVCRSPIAEGLAKKWLSERYGIGIQDLEQAGYKVQSRGCSADFEPVGSPASSYGVTVMREEYGVDVTAHRSEMLSQADITNATHIYCMTQRHHDAVLSLGRKCSGFRSRPRYPALPRAPSSPAAGGGNDCGEDGEKPPSKGTPIMVSVFDPEIPDPWHGTIEYYRTCTSMIHEAVTKALEEDQPASLTQQRQGRATYDQQEDNGEDPRRHS